MEEKRFNTSSAKPESDMAPVPFSPGGDSVPLFQTLTTKLWKGKWILLISIAAFTLVGLMLSALEVPMYKAQTSIEIQSPESDNRQNRSDSSESYIQTQIRIIQSRTLMERTLTKFSDAERARLLESPRFWWSNASYNQNLESIRKRIATHPSEQAGIVDITFTSPDTSAGAHFLNALTQELADYNVERSWRLAQHNRAWTDRQLEDLRRKWEQSEQVLAEYSQSAGVVLASRKVRQDTALEASRRAQPTGASLEANDPKLRELKSRLADLNRQIAQWESVYGPTTPSAVKLRSEAASTEAAIRQRHAVLMHTAGDSQPVPATRKTREPSFAQISPEPSHAETLARLDVLKQEADTNRQVYELADTRLREANVDGAAHIGDITVVDPAIPDIKAANQSSFLDGILGASVGLLFGLCCVALRDRFSNTFTDPAALGKYLGVQVLGTVPIDSLHQAAKGFAHAPEEPALSLAFDKNVQTAEAYRSIRSSILFKVSQRSGPRRLIFTSAGTSEDKTSVVGNLGAALASAQRRVLVIDGDLRNPGLHKVFAMDNDHGLADLLSRQITASPIASRDVIRETQIPDLYLLAAGQAGLRAPEVLSSAQLPQLIREFAKGFDIVLVDSPPVLPYADARSLARAADGVVLIVKAASTDRRAALHALDAISQDGAPIIGTILTDWDKAQSAAA